PVSGPDEHIQTLPAAPALGVAKRLVGDPVEMTPGVYEVTYEILVRNYGNLPISDLQVTDDLTDTFPAPSLFSVVSLVSPTFTVNPAFNGAADTDLLSGADSLTVGASGSITLVVQVTPAAGGPFDNTATASGETPSAVSVTDDSQNGTDPDPDGDGNPGNNNTPTPVSFGPNLFDPPFGVKSVDVRRLPIMRWTVIWINTSNVVAVNAVSSDDIPTGTTFVDDGIPSGYPLPPGAHPTGTTTNGVACVDSSPDTTTTYCYYEGPSVDHPLGRVIWQGTLGPDFGITDPAVADDDIAIRFATRKANGVEAVDNTAVMNSDRNGDGDTDDPGETRTASASASWRLPVSLPEELPATGFAPGKVTLLPQQPAGLEYQGLEDLKLEIAALKLNTSIVGVPLAKSGWQVSWLGNQVGYLEGTAFPTWSGNSVLTAHVYDANGKPGPFVNLNTLKYGDTIVITAYGQKYVYEVRSVRTQVDPDTDVITHEERPWLTLITCQGYDEKSDSYRWRTVVRAVLVKVE
ncbi:MAG TPA: sortase, partial [Anaerolineaceae bacterium]